MIVLIAGGCTMRENAVFSKEGLFRVACINTKQGSTNNQMQKQYYYYLEPYGDIYRYSYEKKSQELLYQAEYVIQTYRISDKYLFYTYKLDGREKVNRVNLETKEEECIYENPEAGNLQIYLENGYLYITIGGNDKYAYRAAMDANFATDLKETDSFFETNDGISTDTEQNVRVGNKNVVIRRDKRAKAEMPYSYQVEGEKEYSISCFEGNEYNRSQLFQQYMIPEGKDTIIGIMNVSDNARTSVDLYQHDIKKDILFCLDIDTGESKILYDTGDNNTRIIGYDSGIIYLFKEDYKIYSHTLTGEETELMSVPHSNDIVFDWSGDYLIVRYRGSDTETGKNEDSEYNVQVLETKND